MKNKDSPNLYEILRAASRPVGEAAPAAPPPAGGGTGDPAQPSLQVRLAAYKAAKLAALSATPPPEPAAAEAAPPLQTAPFTALATPPPAPPPVTSPAATPPLSERVAALGERVIRLTYNTALFAGLVGLGLLFIAYSLGVRAGRAQKPEVAPGAGVVSEPPRGAVAQPPPPPPPAPKAYAIRVAEWPYRSAQERLKANTAAEDLKGALKRAGHPGAEAWSVGTRLVLYLGRFTEVSEAAARTKLEAVRRLRGQNLPSLAQADFEEAPR